RLADDVAVLKHPDPPAELDDVEIVRPPWGVGDIGGRREVAALALGNPAAPISNPQVANWLGTGPGIGPGEPEAHGESGEGQSREPGSRPHRPATHRGSVAFGCLRRTDRARPRGSPSPPRGGRRALRER